MKMKSPNKTPLVMMGVMISTTGLVLVLLAGVVGGVHLFPEVNVTFKNEASHAVDLMCDVGDDHRVTSLGRGETTWWEVEDVLFPLVWCYLQTNDTYFGIFWGYRARWRCGTHCDWRIRNDGIYFVHKDGFLEQSWLYHGDGFM